MTMVVKPLWRGRVHWWSFVASIPLVGLLVIGLAQGTAQRGTALVYGVAWMALFGFSALHHRLLGTRFGRPWMRWADHATIYVAIAGTYTPICLLALPRDRGVPLLAGVWGVAIFAAICKLSLRSRFRRIGGALYIALGWVAVIVLPDFVSTLPWPATALMVLGGLLYTGGAVVLYRRRPDPVPLVFGYHEVWHVFVTAAALCHYLMVAIAFRHASELG